MAWVKYSTVGAKAGVDIKDEAGNVLDDADVLNSSQTTVSGNAGGLSGTPDITVGAVVAATLDISGNIDIDGITNLDVVDIDGAVDMASTLGVTGAITSQGNITAYYSASDLALKENIEPISDSLNKVLTLDGINWTYKNDGRSMTGLIAQQLEKVLPDAVYETDVMGGKPHKAIRYGNVIGLLVEAIKELKEEVDTLKGK